MPSRQQKSNTSTIRPPRLGVNIDHIATLRQLRGTPYPSILEAAEMSIRAGAEQITVHLREDRRHIQPLDVIELKKRITVPLNLEMAATDSMLKFAIKIKPEWVCLVPEKRSEVTTEGGLELKKNFKKLEKIVTALKKSNIKVSLFVEPSLEAMRLSARLKADAVELHTGRYCLATQAVGKKKSQSKIKSELKRIENAAREAEKLGIHVHAGHGFDYENVRAVSEFVRKSGAPLIEEYNIGHAIVCRAALVGMTQSVREMVSAIQAP